MKAARKQIRQLAGVIVSPLISVPPKAQLILSGGGVTPPPTFTHELTLIVIGALLGGFLGPLLMLIDGWIGISPGVKQQKQNYAVQREISESLRTLIALQTRNGTKPVQREISESGSGPSAVRVRSRA